MPPDAEPHRNTAGPDTTASTAAAPDEAPRLATGNEANVATPSHPDITDEQASKQNSPKRNDFGDIFNFCEFLLKLAANLDGSTTRIAGRAGAEHTVEWPSTATPPACVQDALTNGAVARNMGSYIHLCRSLNSIVLPTDRAESTCPQALQEDYVSMLVSFAKLHNIVRGGLIGDFVCHSSVDIGTTLELINQSFAAFFTTTATVVYEQHVGTFLMDIATTIANDTMKLNVVADSVMKSAALDTMALLLIQSPAWTSLLPADRLVFLPDAPVLGATMDSKHNAALSHLRRFVEASGITHMGLNGVSKNNSETDDAPIQLCLLALESICLTKTLCTIVAILQSSLLDPIAGDANILDEDCFGYIVNVVALMGEALVDFDRVLNCPEVHAFEAEGWHVAPPFAFLRTWNALCSIFLGRSRDTLMAKWSKILEAAVKHIKVLCPDWKAVVKSNNFNLALGEKMLAGKVAGLVQAQNQIHIVLANMKSCAECLDIQPKLQFHELTADGITVAESAMSTATLCSIVASGVDLVLGGQGDPDGALRAKQFMKLHKVPKNSDLPDCFWHELEVMANNASTSSPAAPSKRPPPPHSAASPMTKVKIENTATSPATPRFVSTTCPSEPSTSSRASPVAQAPSDATPRPALKRARRGP